MSQATEGSKGTVTYKPKIYIPSTPLIFTAGAANLAASAANKMIQQKVINGSTVNYKGTQYQVVVDNKPVTIPSAVDKTNGFTFNLPDNNGNNSNDMLPWILAGFAIVLLIFRR